MDANKDKKIETDANPLVIDVDPNNPVTEIESLCMNCHDKGITRLLTTKIPFFKDIIVMSFSCPHCGYPLAAEMTDSSEYEPAVKVHSPALVVNEVNDPKPPITTTKKEEPKQEEAPKKEEEIFRASPAVQGPQLKVLGTIDL
jgi:hypothetical protein